MSTCKIIYCNKKRVITEMEKVTIGIAFAILLCIIRVCGYIRSVAKNNFKIRDLVGTGSGEEVIWLDNSKYNKYDISFEALNGSDTKEIISKRALMV